MLFPALFIFAKVVRFGTVYIILSLCDPVHGVPFLLIHAFNFGYTLPVMVCSGRIKMACHILHFNRIKLLREVYNAPEPYLMTGEVFNTDVFTYPFQMAVGSACLKRSIIIQEHIFPKTVIKQALKYAPIRTDFQRALSLDETIKKEIYDDMFMVRNEEIEIAA